jgi:hypothetical protein
MNATTQIAVLAGLAAMVAAGCGSETPKQGSAPAPAARKPSPPPAAPPARTVHFRARDGRKVTARYTREGANAPAVVLLHEIRGGPDQWDPLVPYLHAAGFATLAYESRSSWMESERLPDVLAAIRWLRARPDVDRRRIALVGASIGASTAVLAMATGARRTADAAVALSPPDSADIWKLQDAHRYRPHDLLLISDAAESSSVEGMMGGAVRSRALRSGQDGHGVELLAEARVRNALLGWLKARVN